MEHTDATMDNFHAISGTGTGTGTFTECDSGTHPSGGA
jgi:hypothetical protein